MYCPNPKAVARGAAKPKAQGQATTKTAKPFRRAWSKGTCDCQYMMVRIVMAKTIGTNILATLSAKRWIELGCDKASRTDLHRRPH